MVQSTFLALWVAANWSTVTTSGPLLAKAGAKVEFRWLEPYPVKDLTKDKGLRTTCGPELMYPHKVPVLTNKDILAADFETHNVVMGIAGDHYLISFHLTDGARKKLTAAVGDEPVKELAIFLDGKYWSTAPFQKAKVATYLPQAGYFKSKPDVERIVTSFK
jgi:hypothetical protein